MTEIINKPFVGLQRDDLSPQVRNYADNLAAQVKHTIEGSSAKTYEEYSEQIRTGKISAKKGGHQLGLNMEGGVISVEEAGEDVGEGMVNGEISISQKAEGISEIREGGTILLKGRKVAIP